MQPEILLSFFLGGLHKDIKSYCLLKNPESVHDAVALAREAEIVLRANDGSIVSTQTAQQNEINQLQAQMITLLRNKEATVAAIHPMPPSFPNTQNQQFAHQNNQQSPEPVNHQSCQICGRYNHTAAACRNTNAITSIFSSHFPQHRQFQQYSRSPPTFRPYYNNQQYRPNRQNYNPRLDNRYNQQNRYPPRQPPYTSNNRFNDRNQQNQDRPVNQRYSTFIGNPNINRSMANTSGNISDRRQYTGQQPMARNASQNTDQSHNRQVTFQDRGNQFKKTIRKRYMSKPPST